MSSITCCMHYWFFFFFFVISGALKTWWIFCFILLHCLLMYLFPIPFQEMFCSIILTVWMQFVEAIGVQHINDWADFQIFVLYPPPPPPPFGLTPLFKGVSKCGDFIDLPLYRPMFLMNVSPSVVIGKSFCHSVFVGNHFLVLFCASITNWLPGYDGKWIDWCIGQVFPCILIAV